MLHPAGSPRRHHEMPFGAEIVTDGIRFRLWAPEHDRISVNVIGCVRRGRPWAECVVYELHLGAFTPEGTFRVAIGRLDHLRDLGVTAIELMPIADFPGRWNWGYDGVLPFAPDSTYGRPEDLKALVDAAHSRGIAVLLDVVYNHFGPDGHYLSAYAPIFTEEHETPSGAAVNFDGDGSPMVRAVIVDNALYWVPMLA
jgi:malto-oligosyltrehalose trehalohydrolase